MRDDIDTFTRILREREKLRIDGVRLKIPLGRRRPMIHGGLGKKERGEGRSERRR